jgi:flagellar assembly factor FliW
MPILETPYFGRLSYDESAEIEFAAGMPGFDDERRFVIVEPPAHAPMVYLQSMGRRDLCFLALPVLAVDGGYGLRLGAEELKALGLEEQPVINKEVVCLCLVTIPEEGPVTVNLAAPVVIGRSTRKALQAIQADCYSFRHPLPAPVEG